VSVRTFTRGEVLTFKADGGTATVEKIDGEGMRFKPIIVWLRFDERHDTLVPFGQNYLRRIVR